MSATPSAPVARQGRSASIPSITARGAPSVGLGQKTDTSKAESTSATSRARRGQEVRAPAQRLRQAAQLGLRLPVAREHEVHARVVQQLHGVHHHVVALLGVKARDAADHEGVAPGCPAPRAPLHGPPPRKRISSVRSTLGTTDALRRHAHCADRLLGAGRDRHDQPLRPARRARTSAAAGRCAAGRDRPPLRPHQRRAQLRGQAARHQLLLLVVHEQHVVWRLALQRLAQAAHVGKPAGGQLQAARLGELGADLDAGAPPRACRARSAAGR